KEGGVIEALRHCPDCGGTGSIWKEKVQIPCSYCSGKKYVGPIAEAAERIEVIGDATLLQGDCTKLLPHLSGIDAVVTDPPYKVTSGGFGNLEGGFSGWIKDSYDNKGAIVQCDVDWS